jgi:hypothetical protein
MRKIILGLILSLSPLTANAETFTYTEMCWYLGERNHPWIEKATCKITDVRNSQGFLDKRIIQARVIESGLTYTVKSWFDSRGFMTWDSDSNKTYKIQYKVASPPPGTLRQANLPPGHGITAVNKDLWVRQISWD